MISIFSKFFGGSTPAQSPSPLFESMENRCFLSASIMEGLEAPRPSASAMHVSAPKIRNVRGDYLGTAELPGAPQPLPIQLTVNKQNGANVRGTIGSTGLFDVGFKGTLNKKGKRLEGKFANKEASGKFSASIAADGSVSGTVTLKYQGVDLVIAFALAKQA